MLKKGKEKDWGRDSEREGERETETERGDGNNKEIIKQM